jgi:glyoxylase-like metal-dependent hydrolase (beta-lactamase superfamily II)
MKAAIVDPGFDAYTVLEFISSNNLKLEYIILTHYHHDHSNESNMIKKSIPSKIVTSKPDSTKLNLDADIIVSDGDQLKVGEVKLDFVLTPGHTPGSICIIVDNEALLTGDTLFIGDCGRTDLPGGNPAQMHITLQEKIKSLPDHLIVFPGHDYGDKPFDTLGNLKPRITILIKEIKKLLKK